jgi:FkbH-like protein
MKDFTELKKNLKKDYSHLTQVNIAVLGDTPTQLLSIALRGMGYDRGFHLNIWEADFNQVDRQIFDPCSELYEFAPNVVILFLSAHKLIDKYNKLEPEAYSSFADRQLTKIDKLVLQINARLNANIILYNFNEINDAVFGNNANKVASSFLYQLRKLNYNLMSYATAHANLHICDLSSIQNQAGKHIFFHPSIYVNTEMVLSTDVLPIIAAQTLDIIGAITGRFNKCLILDLDNTIWGGVIGDDGLEHIQLGGLGIGKAFTELQYWIKKLKNRGIILAVCSKNTEWIAKEPFEKHPDMVLRLGDIAVFIANWENKVDNIRRIQNTLNIGFDSIVFLDDNPFERNMVRENIPAITVPELPEDPAEYLEYLYGLNLFETASFSNGDIERTNLYQIEAKRTEVQQGYTNECDFLQSLNMVSVIEPFNKFNTPRVAQLSQRSNQFNLRTVRFTEPDIERMAGEVDTHTFSFTLQDRFGDNGLICVVVLKKETDDTLFIDTWFMSCRVLKRGMEQFVMNTIVNFAIEKSYSLLRGEYLPTPKNELVKDLFDKLGFNKDTLGAYWLNTTDYNNKVCYIATAKNKD